MIRLIRKLDVYNGRSKSTGKPFTSIKWLVESNGRQIEAKVFGNKITNSWYEGQDIDASLTNGNYGMEIVIHEDRNPSQYKEPEPVVQVAPIKKITGEDIMNKLEMLESMIQEIRYVVDEINAVDFKKVTR